MVTQEAKLQQLLHDYKTPGERMSDEMKSRNYRSWLLQQFKEKTDLSLEDFSLYYLNAVRQQTEVYLRCNDNETPKCQSPVRTLQFTGGGDSYSNDTSNVASQRLPLGQQHMKPCSQVSTPRTYNDIKDFSSSPLDSSLRNNSATTIDTSLERNSSHSLQYDTSTPLRRNGNNYSNPRRSGSSFQTNTPNSNEKQMRSNSASSSVCLGDFFLLHSTPMSNRSHRKKTPQSQCQQTNTAEKPKKRVVPTTITNRGLGAVSGQCDAKPFGGNSSFSNENNILRLSHTEIDDKNKCSIMAARKSLKLNASEISKELKTSVGSERELREIIESKMVDVTTKVAEDAVMTPAVVSLPPVRLAEVTNQSTLDRLADIYTVLIDLNFVTNVLNEMTFLLNLLNAQQQLQLPVLRTVEQLDSQQVINSAASKPKTLSSGGQSATTSLDCLANVTNCIYFALSVLRKQRHLLSLLDVKSLGVVLNNERICGLAPDLKLYLEHIHQRKQQLDAQCSANETFDAFLRLDKSFKSVYYQEDKDSRQHFASNNEFAAFKTQRDLFYKALKLWETHHLSPTWNFVNELTPKIREIFKQSENAVNMSHFAKLFVSQLLISSSDTTSPEEMGLEVDAQKFNKLTQRLVTPSNFSVDYQFPRKQVFFRDFISESRSLPFTEQLKMALYSQLMALNDSSFEQLNVLSSDKDADELETAQYENSEFIVRPEVLASMIILAKFLGFVTALPYSQNNATSIPASVEKKQISLRSLFQPHFNVCQLLQDAIKTGKLLITLPWLVQYLAMLDNVTLQLTNFVEATQILFALYARLGVTYTRLTHTSIFIVRCCLGWLFEQKPFIAEQYYSYRATHTTQFSTESASETQEIRLLISNELMKELPTNSPLHIASLQRVSNGNYTCVLQQEQKLDNLLQPINNVTKSIDYTCAKECLNPMVESLLNVACPFLAEFRVSIMPAKYATTKYVSRTGRYRHITTRIAELYTPTASSGNSETTAITRNTQQQQQYKLIEAFLHSQNASMRRLIEFVTERSYKSVVKDAQYKFLLPSKSIADSKVNEIASSDEEEVSKCLSYIYEQARDEAKQQWQRHVPKLLDERIQNALNALLPIETTPIIWQTYFLLIRRNARQKVEQWFYANMLKDNFYCNNPKEIAQKICKANKRERQAPTSSELKIVKIEPSMSDLLDDLQYWLHCTSIRTDLLTTPTPIIAYLKLIPTAFENTLPTVFYRLVGAGIVQLLQHLIIRNTTYLTAQLMRAACSVWLQPQMQSAINIHKMSREKPTNSAGEESDDNNAVMSYNSPNIYNSLVTIGFIESLGACHLRYEKLQQLLTTMIEQHVLTVDEVNVLFMPILKQEWPANVLNKISEMLQCIAKDTLTVKAGSGNSSDEDEAKSHLFMEVLADFSRDVDDF